LFTSSQIIDQFSQFFHWHTLWTICNHVIVIHPATPSLCFYTTLWNTSEIYIHNENNKHFGKWNKNKKHFKPTLWWMICVTLDCVGLTQSSVIRFTHHNVGLKSFFIYLNVCYYCWFFLKEFWKSVNNWQRYGQKQSDTFFTGPQCTTTIVVVVVCAAV